MPNTEDVVLYNRRGEVTTVRRRKKSDPFSLRLKIHIPTHVDNDNWVGYEYKVSGLEKCVELLTALLTHVKTVKAQREAFQKHLRTAHPGSAQCPDECRLDIPRGPE